MASFFSSAASSSRAAPAPADTDERNARRFIRIHSIRKRFRRLFDSTASGYRFRRLWVRMNRRAFLSSVSAGAGAALLLEAADEKNDAIPEYQRPVFDLRKHLPNP